MVWKYLPKNKWNGQVAADTYTQEIQRSLKRTYPNRIYFNVLEDNDPAGFKSKKGEDAKAQAHIRVFEIPKRSPQLNVCDYALWSEVNRRMRALEQGWPASKVESRKDYLERLRRVALRLPKKFIVKSNQDMKRRCQRLWEKKGFHFEEGGAGP